MKASSRGPSILEAQPDPRQHRRRRRRRRHQKACLRVLVRYHLHPTTAEMEFSQPRQFVPLPLASISPFPGLARAGEFLRAPCGSFTSSSRLFSFAPICPSLPRLSIAFSIPILFSLSISQALLRQLGTPIISSHKQCLTLISFLRSSSTW